MKCNNLETCLISPPFGNYFSHPAATRIRGSFTALPRPGLIWNTMKSFRKTKGGWINKIGLRNCGIHNVMIDEKSVYSLAAVNTYDWLKLYVGFPLQLNKVEINLGCPNISTVPPPSKGMFDLFHASYDTVIVKVAPTPEGYVQACSLIDTCGVNIIHACNTIPTEKGGISGDQLRKHSKEFVYKLRAQYPNLTIIAGGGIYEESDIDAFAQLGADHFSLSTAFMKPWKAKRLISYAADKVFSND